MGSRAGRGRGWLGEETVMFWGERMLTVLLGGKPRLCFTAGPEIIPGGHSATGSPWEQGKPGPVMPASPELRDGVKRGGMRPASHATTPASQFAGA